MSLRQRQKVQALLRKIKRQKRKKLFTYAQKCHMIKKNKKSNAQTRRVSRQNAAERDAFSKTETFRIVLRASLQEAAQDHLEAALIRSGDPVIVQ